MEKNKGEKMEKEEKKKEEKEQLTRKSTARGLIDRQVNSCSCFSR